MGEIIRIEVLDVAGRSFQFRDVVTRARGSADSGAFELETGAELLIELETRAGRRKIGRVLEQGGPRGESERLTPDQATNPSDEPAVLLNGVPIVLPDSTAPITVGDVRTAEIPFTSATTGERDRGRTAKRRPCVVTEVDGDHISVCAIHGTNSAVRRSGTGRRLQGWRELGLRKPSYVAAGSTWVRRDTVGDLIGVLDTADRRRLGL
ncbi:MAG: hypothetical protein ACE5GB_11330 [Acidimicrobiales bacterium]